MSYAAERDFNYAFASILSTEFAVPQPQDAWLMSTTLNSEPRFAFGENWLRFLQSVDDSRIAASMQGLRQMLGRERLDGQTFLDIGCGSGLSSLAAIRLGASVVSFDFDRDSVECTRELKRRYAPEATQWTVQQGSALDAPFMASLGRFDIVYSWGVLHHTGDQRRLCSWLPSESCRQDHSSLRCITIKV